MAVIPAPSRRPSRIAIRRTALSYGGELDAESRAILRHWYEAVPDDRIAHLVRDLGRAFLRSLQIRLAVHGVALGHWTFLRVLWAHDGLTQRELSLEAGVMEPTTVVAIRAMESLGYVTREHRRGNRKNVHVRLTALGRDLERRLVPIAEAVNAIALAGFPQAEVARLRRGLLRMLEQLSRDPALVSPGGAAPRAR